MSAAIATAVVREGGADAFTGGGDLQPPLEQQPLQAGTATGSARARRSQASCANGFGGVTNFSYSGKHLGVNGHYDHIGSTFRNTDLGFLSSRVNKNEINGGMNLNPARSVESVPIARTMFVTATRQWNDDGLVFGKFIGAGTNLEFPQFLERVFQHVSQFPQAGRPRHPRRPADRQARQLQYELWLWNRLAEALGPVHESCSGTR